MPLWDWPFILNDEGGTQLPVSASKIIGRRKSGRSPVRAVFLSMLKRSLSWRVVFVSSFHSQLPPLHPVVILKYGIALLTVRWQQFSRACVTNTVRHLHVKEGSLSGGVHPHSVYRPSSLSAVQRSSASPWLQQLKPIFNDKLSLLRVNASGERTLCPWDFSTLTVRFPDNEG